MHQFKSDLRQRLNTHIHKSAKKHAQNLQTLRKKRPECMCVKQKIEIQELAGTVL